MTKMDLQKELKHLYHPSAKEVVLVDVPTMYYLMVDGEGDPNNSQAFSDAVEVLFAVSYTLKFKVKKGPLAIDYGVMPLEGLWWADDMSRFSIEDKTNCMIRDVPRISRFGSLRSRRRVTTLEG